MKQQNTPILVISSIYFAALAMTSALLVFWVLVVQRFTSEINQLVSKLGVEWSYFHWFVGSTGAGLIFLVSMALTYLLAITLSERRYRVKQEHFLSNMTHELKSPLAGIKIHAQTMQQASDLEPDEIAHMSGLIVREAERVGKLVENLLESGRLASGKAAGELQRIDLRRFFQQYQDDVRTRFDVRHIDLQFEIKTRSVVMATNESLQRVMDNLISNALRFTDDGGTIECSVRDLSEQTEIVVADNGIGIPKTELTKIFERFHRLQRDVDEQRKGTGLGLAIVRGLVEEMRGRVKAVSSEEQPGTRIEIQLPQVAAGSADERLSRTETSPTHEMSGRP